MANPNLPLDASARAVLERAREESARLRHEYVGTEHLALALLRLTPLSSGQLLKDSGVDAAAARAAIESAVPAGKAGVESDTSRPFTIPTGQVLALAQQHATALGDTAVGAEHLLVGLLQEPGIGGQMLAQQGVSADAVLRFLSPRRAH